VIWALGRAGRRALARGLLSTAEIPAGEAVEIGIAHQVLVDRMELPLPPGVSLAAVTSARDLMRSAPSRSAGLALELAAFRLLFAAGDPKEGATAFLDKRDPSF
jgi:enoyl-CoA hydratase/carnithine racemase